MIYYYRAFNYDRKWSKIDHDINHYKKLPLDQIDDIFRKIEVDLPVLIYLTIDTIVVDVDPRNGGLTSLVALSDAVGQDLTNCSKFPILKTGRGGFHIFFTNPEKIQLRANISDFPGIDILSEGYKSYAPVSQFNLSIYKDDLDRYSKDTTKDWDGCYKMLEGSISIEDAPVVPTKLVQLFEKPKNIAIRTSTVSDWTKDQVEYALSFLKASDFRDYSKWRNLLFAVKNACSEAKDQFINWSLTDQKYSNDLEKIEGIWHAAKVDHSEKSVTVATLYKHLMSTSINLNELLVYKKDLSSEFRKAPVEPLADTDVILCGAHWQHFYYVGSWNRFYHVQLRQAFKREAFNAMFPSDEKKGAATTFLTSHTYRKKRVAHARYEPYFAERFELHHLPILNTWNGKFPVKRKFDRKAVLFWLDHINYLFCGNEAYIKHFHDYFAALLQRERKRLNFSLVIVSPEEGVGKTTPITHLCNARFGIDNVGTITNESIEDKFNAQITDKEVVIYEDADKAGRYNVVNKLKPWLSDQYIERRQKHVDAEKVSNFAAYIILTNNIDALAISSKSRRFLVLKSEAKPKSHTYIKELLNYLAISIDEVVQYYLHYDIDLSQYCQRACATDAKQEMMIEAAPIFVRLITEIFEEYQIPFVDSFIALKPFYDTYFYDRSWATDTSRIGNAIKFLDYRYKFQVRTKEGKRLRVYCKDDKKPDLEEITKQLDYFNTIEID